MLQGVYFMFWTDLKQYYLNYNISLELVGLEVLDKNLIAGGEYMFQGSGVLKVLNESVKV